MESEDCGAMVNELRQTIAEIDRLLAVRNRHLEAYERLLLERLMSQEISFLNLASRKAKIIPVMREKALLQLQCRILRRNIFYLRYRREKHMERLAALGVPIAADPVRVDPAA